MLSSMLKHCLKFLPQRGIPAFSVLLFHWPSSLFITCCNHRLKPTSHRKKGRREECRQIILKGFYTICLFLKKSDLIDSGVKSVVEESWERSLLVLVWWERGRGGKAFVRSGEEAGEGKRHVADMHSLYPPCAALVLVMQGSHFDVLPLFVCWDLGAEGSSVGVWWRTQRPRYICAENTFIRTEKRCYEWKRRRQRERDRH